MLVHGNNLTQKENHKKKYIDQESRRYLAEIREKYDQWSYNNNQLIGPIKTRQVDDHEIITQRVNWLNDYKDFLDQKHYAEKFDSRSNLHSSVLEEFMYYLFRDLVTSISEHALIGKSHSFKDIFFRPSNYDDMIKKPNAVIEKKDHDFSIGCTIQYNLV
ncbi:Bpu10I family restriction endonuclease [Spirulina sp. CS-785/01]|nr:Bpu10I family restriction endonuclease [Spirulina sp. CS-785/01]MDB9314772.1 Bpu10I family restriction endonuclease [Spirulina sp. CS-785/01]